MNINIKRVNAGMTIFGTLFSVLFGASYIFMRVFLGIAHHTAFIGFVSCGAFAVYGYNQLIK